MEVDLPDSYWLLGVHIRSLTAREKDDWLVPGKASRIGSAQLTVLDGVSDEKPTRMILVLGNLIGFSSKSRPRVLDLTRKSFKNAWSPMFLGTSGWREGWASRRDDHLPSATFPPKETFRQILHAQFENRSDIRSHR
jgi:hypothetical protein